MLEWLQSFEGIITFSFGSISLTAIVLTGFTLFRLIKERKNASEILSYLGKMGFTIENIVEKITGLFANTEELKQNEESMEIELLERIEIETTIMKLLSIIVAASGGIEPVTKVNLLNELKESQDKINLAIKEKTEVKEEVVKTLEEKKEETAVKVKEELEETKKEVKTLIEKFSQK